MIMSIISMLSDISVYPAFLVGRLISAVIRITEVR